MNLTLQNNVGPYSCNKHNSSKGNERVGNAVSTRSVTNDKKQCRPLTIFVIPFSCWKQLGALSFFSSSFFFSIPSRPREESVVSRERLTCPTVHASHFGNADWIMTNTPAHRVDHHLVNSAEPLFLLLTSSNFQRQKKSDSQWKKTTTRDASGGNSTTRTCAFPTHELYQDTIGGAG